MLLPFKKKFKFTDCKARNRKSYYYMVGVVEEHNSFPLQKNYKKKIVRSSHLICLRMVNRLKTKQMSLNLHIVFRISIKNLASDSAISHSMGGFALLRAIKDGLSMQSAAIIGSGDSIKGVFIDSHNNFIFLKK